MPAVVPVMGSTGHPPQLGGFERQCATLLDWSNYYFGADKETKLAQMASELLRQLATQPSGALREEDLLSLRGRALSVTDPDQATALLERGLRRNPLSQASWTCLGELYFGKGEVEKACTCFHNSLDFTGESATICRNLSIVLRKMERPNTSQAQHHVAVGNGAAPIPGKRQSSRSLEWAQRAVEIDPDDLLNWEGLGNFHLDRFGQRNTTDSLQKAAEAYERAAILDRASTWGRSPTLYHNLGLVKLFSLNFGESYDAFEVCARTVSQYAEQAKNQMRTILEIAKALDEHVNQKGRMRASRLQSVAKHLKEHCTKRSASTKSDNRAVFGGWRECVEGDAADSCRDPDKKKRQVLTVKIVHKIEVDVPVLLICVDQNQEFFVLALSGTDANQLMKKVKLGESIVEVTHFEKRPLVYNKEDNCRSWNCVHVQEPKHLSLDGHHLGNLAISSLND
ncbi:unnamed protein product [Amoebophrya sp. A120]|nr:unnamed protein product [Amoebophrya sp. A120]|eukprot:GSA120T00017501001.1